MQITKDRLLVGCVGLLCVFVIILFLLQTPLSESFESQTIPKQIWTYWDTIDSIPAIVQKCIDSWKKYNPEYTVHVVTKDTVDQFVAIPTKIKMNPNFNDTRSRFADLVRLYLLDQHGGIWIDASCVMYQGFDEWLPFHADMFCYTYNQGHPEFKYPVLENWFIASKPNTPFVSAWKKEFLEIANYANVQEYVNSRRALGVNISTLEHMANYLAMHIAAQKLIQIDKLSLQNAVLEETSVRGPMRFLIKNRWNAKKAIREVCLDKSLRKPFLKFHGPSREEFSKLVETELTNERCEWF